MPAPPIAPVLSDAECDAIREELVQVFAYRQLQWGGIPTQTALIRAGAAAYAAAQSEPQGVPREPTQDMAYRMRQAVEASYRPGADVWTIARAVWQAGWDTYNMTHRESSAEFAHRVAAEVFAAPPATPDKGFEAHTKAVAEFLMDLYAIMVDPCAEGTITVADMKAALLKAATEQREALAATPDKVSGEAHGTFNCPICGHDKPHGHDRDEIRHWMQITASRFGVEVWVLNKDTAAKKVTYDESQRGRFEAWTLTYPARPFKLRIEEDGHYSDPGTNVLWDCWQHASPPAPAAGSPAAGEE